MLPEPASTRIRFAHPVYRLHERFALRASRTQHAQTFDPTRLSEDLADAHVLVISGWWREELLAHAPRLRYIQICAAGHEQFDTNALRARGIRLCNAAGVNANAVSEHALGLMLTLTRQLHLARDNQRHRHWRPLIADPDHREDELPGKTVLIVGAGRIGTRLARLCRALQTTVIGIKRDVREHDPAFDEVHPPEAFQAQLPRADFIVLCCPLTDQTRDLLDADAFMLIRPHAYLINVARGGCVDEAALLHALNSGELRGAAIDVSVHEPLPPTSPLWTAPNLVITPHSGGETPAYEDRVLDVLEENLERLWRGETNLRNAIV
ncbi:MAG: D-2-hydroxyacid dehydrogenase [Gammaproteobacteria bacterium]|nr:D-2-hydroxyacid dehydrogenase [Gammaproteobacteria bacterium]